MYFFKIITEPVKTVHLTPEQIIVDAGKEMNLTCKTSLCNPPANITWYLSSTDITNHSSITTTDNVGGLFSKESSLLMRIDKLDNEKLVYCTARNVPGRTINSTFYVVNVLCKYIPSPY